MNGQALAGLRVVDFTWVGVGPPLTKYLADFGAEVIRIESRTHLDSVRFAPLRRRGTRHRAQRPFPESEHQQVTRDAEPQSSPGTGVSLSVDCPRRCGGGELYLTCHGKVAPDL